MLGNGLVEGERLFEQDIFRNGFLDEFIQRIDAERLEHQLFVSLPRAVVSVDKFQGHISSFRLLFRIIVQR